MDKYRACFEGRPILVYAHSFVSLDRQDCFHNLPRYVREGGGGLLFQHDLCGFGRSPLGQATPFPEICPKAAGRKDALAVDRDGDPVVGVGEAGSGKVILDGNVNLTKDDRDEVLTGFNAALAQGAVEWFTGVRLEK